MSEYSAFSNNPVFNTDIKGDSSNPGSKTPIVSLRIGSTGGALFPWSQNQATSIFPLYGNKTYYNSLLNDNSRTGSTFKPDEPNSFVQLQVRIGNIQVGLNWFKQKFRENSEGFGYEAPTAVQASFGMNKNLASIGNKINISSNISFGTGIEVGVPRNTINSSITFQKKKYLEIIQL